MRADGRTDMTNVLVAFAEAPKSAMSSRSDSDVLDMGGGIIGQCYVLVISVVNQIHGHFTGQNLLRRLYFVQHY